MAPSPAAEVVEEAEEQAEGAQASASNRHPSQQPWGEGLPPGWKRRTDFGVFKGYQGPQGYKARTVTLAWAAHAEMLADVQAGDPKFQAQAGAQAAQRGRRLRAGARVMARYGGGAAWYAGAVAAVRADGSLDIAYDDGDQEPGVPPHLVRPEGGDEDWEDLAAVVEERPAARMAPSPAAEVVEEAEGLRLHLSSKSCTGYKGVTFSHSASKPYRAYVAQGNCTLGTFATAVEAAVRYARHVLEVKDAEAKGGVKQRAAALPDGWVRKVHAKSSKLKHGYTTYKGPNGEFAQTVAQTWVRHEASQRPPATAAGGSMLRPGSPKQGHEQAGPSAQQRSTDPPPAPHAPLLSDDRVRQLAEAKELKDKELIDEDEYKQMKAVILGKAIAGVAGVAVKAVD